jgi:ABC-type transport system involved in multi-copper enzyme maturation permease subunit
VSIFLPDYSRPPPVLLPRRNRVAAILSTEIRARSRVVNYVVLAMIYLVVDVPIVFEFYFRANFGAFLPSSAPTLSLFLAPFGAGPWAFFLVLLSSSVGAAIIAGDFATRAITMYFARPITRADYLVAKAGAVGFWIALGAVAPGVVGTIIVLALGYVGLPLAVEAVAAFVLVGLVTVVALTGITLFLSSLTSRSVFAGAAIFGTLVGAEAIGSVLSAVGRQSAFLYVSPIEDFGAVARGVFQAAGNPLNPWVAAGVLLGLGLVAGGLAFGRLRRAEVIAE